MDHALVWFRRDLRDTDHAPLAAALAAARAVYTVFVFDRAILDPLPADDRRVAFIHAALRELDAALRRRGGRLIVLVGDPVDAIPALAERLSVGAVYCGRDYEPAAKRRDARVAARLAEAGRRLVPLRDQAVFDGDQLRTRSGTPYTVFTPYRNAWLRAYAEHPVLPGGGGQGALAPVPETLPALPSLAVLGFAEASPPPPALGEGMRGAQSLLEAFLPRLGAYAERRDYPASKGVSYLSAHLRFGTLSIRGLVDLAWRDAGPGAMCWLDELIWRDFYFMILDHFPHVVTGAFRREYDALIWRSAAEGADERFAAWCAGLTGYPLVDAGMRQLAASGYQHNRLRMITASFLIKDLGVDWRRGEAWFAARLNDFDLAANNGGWQWAASTGCDAAPYFRIFNPVTQSEKFDPQGSFIRRYVPELARVPERYLHAPWRMPDDEQRRCGVRIGVDYPAPVVDHAQARAETLARYERVRALRA